MNRKRSILALVAAALLLSTAACKASEPYNDSKSTGTNETSPAQVFSNVDGFSNWDEKCDTSGHLISIIYHGDGSYGAITMVLDPKACPKAGPPVTLADQH